MGRIPHDCTLGAESALQTFSSFAGEGKREKGFIVANNANLSQSSIASVFVIWA